MPLPGATNIEPFDPADFDDLFPFDFDAVPGGGGSLPQANPSGSRPRLHVVDRRGGGRLRSGRGGQRGPGLAAVGVGPAVPAAALG